MRYIFVVAGFDVITFDKIKSISTNKFFKDGVLISRPLKEHTYSPSSCIYYVNHIRDHVNRFYDDDLCILLIYADHKDAQTESFRASFFPFALTYKLDPPRIEKSAHLTERNRLLNEFFRRFNNAVDKLKDSVASVRAVFSGNNLTPLLLPIVNFKSNQLRTTLYALFVDLATSQNPRKILDKARDQILEQHPWVTPPNSKRRCLSDGTLHFKSPGSARHGRARFSNIKNHRLTCHLNGKCRLGAAYDGTFHYDCEPVKGNLKTAYDNCHLEAVKVKKSHMNIAPNDFII